MRIRDVLQEKGHEVVSIPSDRTVLDAIRLLVDRNIGSLVITRAGTMVGILTERDILRLAADRAGTFGALRVADVMTAEVLTAAPDDEIAHAMELMTRNRVRHLPVVSGDTVRGLLSIGDVVNALRRSVQTENDHLKQYIRGTIY